MARTMATITERRAAAELRRRQAGEAGDRGGDAAFMLYRSQAPGVGRGRTVSTPTQLRAAKESRNGRTMVHTWGLFTRYERGYPMWDTFGEYEEITARGSGRKSLAASPDVAYLVNHRGVTMARTRNGTLVLEDQHDGAHHDGWLNPDRQDVRDYASAVDDGLITEMSYAFMIPDGGGLWSEDFMQFRINEWDIDRGDVSGVNYGANPYTDIAGQTPDVLDAIDRLPAGALREAAGRLAARGQEPARERIEVRTMPRRVDPDASRAVRALQGRQVRTAARFVELAERTGMSVAQIVTAQLPWYEIREASAVSDPDGEPAAPESTDVLIYEEIGGSFGVDAHAFAEDLAAITTPTIRIRVNSPGGSVFDGEAIHSAILQHPSHTIGVVDGIAASAASMLLTACDEIVMMPAGEVMIHDASMTTDGNAADHGKGQTYLDRHSDHLATLYADRMGITQEEARQLMLDETWLFPQEAVDAGYADRVGTRADALPESDPGAERMARRHDMTTWAYRHTSRADAGAPRQTRAAATPLPSFETEGDDRAAAIRAEVERRTGGDRRSSAPEPMGRSIALIEATLASAERE